MRWRNQYYTDLVREDILEFGRVQEIRSMRLLLELLRERVGSPVSYTSLAGNLQLAPNTVRRYIDILESLCVIFPIRPFHANVARAILREPKVYFYDSGYVKGDEGVRLENTCAVVCRSISIICRTRPGTMSPSITSGPKTAARSILRSPGRGKPTADRSAGRRPLQPDEG